MDDRHMNAVLAYCREICQPAEAEDVAREIAAATRSSEEIDDQALLAATRRIAASHSDVPGVPPEWRRLLQQVREARARRAFTATLGGAPIIAVPEAATVEFAAVGPAPPAPAEPKPPVIDFPAQQPDLAREPEPARRGMVVFPAAAAPPEPEQDALPASAAPGAPSEPVIPPAPLMSPRRPAGPRRPRPLGPLPTRTGVAAGPGPIGRYRVFLAAMAVGVPVVVIVALAVNSGSASTISLPPPSPLVDRAAQNSPVVGAPARRRHRHRHHGAPTTTALTSATVSSTPAAATAPVATATVATTASATTSQPTSSTTLP